MDYKVNVSFAGNNNPLPACQGVSYTMKETDDISLTTQSRQRVKTSFSFSSLLDKPQTCYKIDQKGAKW